MLSRISRLAIFLIVLTAVLYIVLLNRDPITVHLAGENTFTAMGGVVLIVTFGLGILTASLVGVFFGVRSYLREQRLHAKERKRKALLEGLRLARSHVASREWNKARAEYEQLIRRHPHDSIARVELSQVIEQQGDPREALRLVDAARVETPHDVEVLLRAAELNVALNNKTAAVDNLALVLASQPSKYAARMARDLSEELERFDDALEYQDRLDGLGYQGKESERYKSRIRFKKLLKDTPDALQLQEALTVFVKREHSSSALEKLADLCAAAGDKLGAAQHLARVARQDGAIEPLKRANALWLELNQPEQALATVRATSKETSGATRVAVELELIRILITLRMLDEAKGALAKLPALLAECSVTLNPEVTAHIQSLQALAAVKLGDTNSADATLTRLTQGSLEIDWGTSRLSAKKSSEAPAPRLSTP